MAWGDHYSARLRLRSSIAAVYHIYQFIERLMYFPLQNEVKREQNRIGNPFDENLDSWIPKIGI